METLIEKLRKARQSEVQVEGFTFIIRRPTDVEAVGMRGASLHSVVSQFVVGWKGVTELDLVPGGNPTPAPFDPELWAEWSADHPEFWEPVVNAVLLTYQKHRGAVEDVEKN